MFEIDPVHDNKFQRGSQGTEDAKISRVSRFSRSVFNCSALARTDSRLTELRDTPWPVRNLHLQFHLQATVPPLGRRRHQLDSIGRGGAVLGPGRRR
jgi:hypothetical protein